MSTLLAFVFAAVAAATPVPQSDDVQSSWQKRHAQKLELLGSSGADVVFVGDDLVQAFEASYGAKDVWDSNWAAAPYGAVNLGFAGDYTENVLWRVTEGGELDGYAAKVVVVAVGHSNFKVRRDAVEDAVQGVAAILDAIRTKQPTAKIVLCAIVPQYATSDTPYLDKVAAANLELAKLADGATVRWCGYDKAFERLPPGYLRWTGALTPFVNAVLRHDVPPAAGGATPVAYRPATPAGRVNADVIIDAKEFLGSNVNDRVILRATGIPVVDLELAKYSNGRRVIWCGVDTDAACAALIAEASAQDQLPVGPLYPEGEGEEIVYGRVAATTPEARICESSWRGPDWWGDRLARNRRVIRTSGGKIDFVFAGDSITHFWEDYGPENFAALKRVYSILNCGYGGDQTQNVLWRFQNGELDGYTAKAVMLMIGTNNNGINGYDPANTALGVKACIAEIRNRQPTAKVLLMAYFPRAVGSADGDPAADGAHARNQATMDVLREAVAGDDSVEIIDIASQFLDSDGKIRKSLMGDYIHPTEAGYSLWSAAAVPVFAALTGVEPSQIHGDYEWGKAGDSYDGRFDDPAHWTLNGTHAVPGLGDRAYMGAAINTDFSVFFPEGIYENFARFAVTARRLRTRTLDLSSTVFRHARNTGGTYNAYGQFSVIYDDYVKDILALNLANATPNADTAPHLEISNTVMTACSPEIGKMSLDFNGGGVNFGNVLGHVWTSDAYPRLYLFSFNNNGASTGAPSMDEAKVSFRNGASLQAHNLCLQGNAATNVLSFSGGTHTARHLNLPARYDGQSFSESRTVTDVVVDDGADFSVSELIYLMQNVQSANRVGRLIVRGGGRLGVKRLAADYGESELIADGGTIEFTDNQSLDKSTMKSVSVIARNGGEIFLNQSRAGGIGMYLGNGDVDGMGCAKVDIADATLRLCAPYGKLSFYNGEAKFGKGARIDNNATLNFPGNAASPISVTFDGAVVSNRAYLAFGASGAAHVTVTNTVLHTTGAAPSGIQCDDATIDISDSIIAFASGAGWYLGYGAGKTATLNFRSGTVDNSGAGSSVQFEIGRKGTGRMNVYGGVLNLGRLRLGADFDTGASSAAENVLDIEGGYVNLSGTADGDGLCANYNANRSSRIVLNGGELSLIRLYKTAGTAHFEADGGTIRAIADSERMIRGLDSAKIGTKGLTIDNAGHSVDFDVAFVDKQGERGSLVLTGAGTTALSAALDLTGLSELVLSNVTVRLDVAHTVSVGALAVTNATLAFASTPALGEHRIFSLMEMPSDETKAALDEMARRERPEGVRFEVRYAESEGRVFVTLVVRQATVTLLDGERLGVASRAQLNETIRLKDGVLAFEGEAFVCEDDDFLFSQESANDHVIVETRGDVSLALPRSENLTGGFTKRGEGNLTMRVRGSRSAFCGDGTDDVSKGYWCERVSLVYPMMFDAETGFMTNGTYGAINVIEGEMRLVGEGEGATVLSSGHLTVSRPCPDGAVSPGLVLDNVAWSNVTPRYVSIASATKYSTPVTDDFADEPYLVLTNGASIYASTFYANRLNNNRDQRTCVSLYDSALTVTYLFSPNRAQSSAARSEWMLSGSRLFTSGQSYGIQLWRDCTMVFDNSVWAKNAGLEPSKISTESGMSSATGTLLFRNGSKMCCSAILAPTKKLEHPLTLVFDDSEWIPSLDGDYAFAFEKPDEILVVATNKGLRVTVPAGRVWTFSQPVTGPGDFTQAGAGTVRFDAGALAYGGATRALAGSTVDFGGNAFAATLAGSGTFANGVVTAGGIRLDPAKPADVPTAAATLAFAGTTRVDLGYGRDPIPTDTAIVVAKYEGEAPDVSSWRLKRGGRVRGVFAVDAASKTVTVTPEEIGTMLIVR